MAGWHHRLDGHGFEETPELVMDREAWRAAAQGSQRVGHGGATELNWTERRRRRGGEESACQGGDAGMRGCRKCGFDPCRGKILWSRQ